MREIKKPAFMKEAEKTKSHSILGEMIIFIVLYVISIFVEAMALVQGFSYMDSYILSVQVLNNITVFFRTGRNG